MPTKRDGANKLLFLTAAPGECCAVGWRSNLLLGGGYQPSAGTASDRAPNTKATVHKIRYRAARFDNEKCADPPRTDIATSVVTDLHCDAIQIPPNVLLPRMPAFCAPRRKRGLISFNFRDRRLRAAQKLRLATNAQLVWGFPASRQALQARASGGDAASISTLA
jgi:hypothetical protein